ncbi:GIY-YIG nuclease family protein [Micromonospora arida]|uniref:GIY-YIG nuclease family protein n=1 Tax=Micromonospora arida TaxID=2203715 RepID=UPI0036782CF8
MPPLQRPRGEIKPYANVFAIDLHAALLDQLPQALDALKSVPLTEGNLSSLRSEHGVYQLFHAGKPVYIGKSQESLRSRLNQHRRRCMGRLGIRIDDMAFRCLYVDKFVDAASPESVLIKKYRREGLAPWNIDQGFAPKDVGHGRSLGKPGKWFLDRPVDHSIKIEVTGAGRPMAVRSALDALKSAVPFDLFRFATEGSGSAENKASVADYVDREVVLEAGATPLMSHLRQVVAALPIGWQATVGPPGVQIYREEVNYAYAIDGWRHGSQGVLRLERGKALPANEK